MGLTISPGTIAVSNGGTGQTSYTDGQLLIGNSTGNTLVKAALTGTANQVVVTNGGGTITLSLPQSIATGSTPTFAGVITGSLTSTSASYNQANFFNPVAGDTNWAYGIFNSGSSYFMQVKYAEAGDGLRGFRVFDTAAATTVFQTSRGNLKQTYDASNYFTAAVSSAGAVTLDAAGSSAGFTFSKRIVNTLPLRLKGYTVAGLPAGTQGDTAFCTDLLAPGFLVAAVGGGAVVGPVFYNGTAWVAY